MRYMVYIVFGHCCSPFKLLEMKNCHFVEDMRTCSKLPGATNGIANVNMAKRRMGLAGGVAVI